jgi:hypothetical protein
MNEIPSPRVRVDALHRQYRKAHRLAACEDSVAPRTIRV